VHGAKGLEAPIVILADTTTPPGGPPGRQPRLLPLVAAGAPPGRPPPFVWATRKADDVPLVTGGRAAANAAAENEYRRLLYVAMTRAADRLIICGAKGERPNPPGCWYDLVQRALTPHAVEEAAEDGDGMVWRLRSSLPTGEPSAPTAPLQTVFAFTAGRPTWLDRDVPHRDAPLTAKPADKLAPSRVAGPLPIPPPHSAAKTRVDALALGEGGERGKALLRGIVVHRLLQALPAIAPQQRAEAARRHLGRAASLLSPSERDSVAEQVCALLEDQRFGELFGGGSRAEVPIVGRITLESRTVAVTGQVDRLAVTAAGVLIADYKTDRAPPRRVADVPEAYVRQLALYREVLSFLYPGRPVRTLLVWTEVPDLMEISGELLDRAVAALTSP